MNATDARGTRHRRCDDHGKLRIVSLAPSLTELLCDLGLGAQVVGRTRACLRPADEIDRIAKVGGPRDVDVDHVRRLAPTHLVVGMDDNESSTIAALEAFVPHVVVVRPRAPRDNPGLYRLFGHVFACEREADRLCARFEAAWETLSGMEPGQTRRVLVLVANDPWTTIDRDGYLAAVLALIGWLQVEVDLVPSSASPFDLDLDRGIRDADLVLLAVGPYPFTDSHVAMLAARGATARLVDGALLSSYGSRAIAALGYLGALAQST